MNTMPRCEERPLLRRGTAALMGGLVVALALVVPTKPSDGLPSFTLTRLAGGNRYATAATIAQAAFPAGAAGALLATGESFPDALAASFLAGARNVPVLLTPSLTLHADARAAIMVLKGPRTAFTLVLLGGTGALGPGVESEVASIPGVTVERIGGATRYETSRLVAAAGAAAVGSPVGRRTAVVANGDGFADALAAGPVAFAAKLPIVLTTGASLHAEAEQSLRSLEIEHALIIGGVGALSTDTEAAVRGSRTPNVSTERLAGADRGATAVAVANYARSTLGFSRSGVSIARGDDFPDALAGVVHAAAGSPIPVPIILTESRDSLGLAARGFLADSAATLTGGSIYGGTGAVGQGVQDEAVAAGSGSSPPTSSSTTSTSTPPPSGYAGEWQGTTSQGRALSFTVVEGGISRIQFALEVRGDVCTVTSSGSATRTPPWPISGNSFSAETGVLPSQRTFAGTFTSSSSASGTYTLRLRREFNQPCTASADLTWIASRSA